MVLHCCGVIWMSQPQTGNSYSWSGNSLSRSPVWLSPLWEGLMVLGSEWHLLLLIAVSVVKEQRWSLSRRPSCKVHSSSYRASGKSGVNRWACTIRDWEEACSQCHYLLRNPFKNVEYWKWSSLDWNTNVENGSSWCVLVSFSHTIDSR